MAAPSARKKPRGALNRDARRRQPTTAEPGGRRRSHWAGAALVPTAAQGRAGVCASLGRPRPQPSAGPPPWTQVGGGCGPFPRGAGGWFVPQEPEVRPHGRFEACGFPGRRRPRRPGAARPPPALRGAALRGPARPPALRAEGKVVAPLPPVQLRALPPFPTRLSPSFLRNAGPGRGCPGGDRAAVPRLLLWHRWVRGQSYLP